MVISVLGCRSILGEEIFSFCLVCIFLVFKCSIISFRLFAPYILISETRAASFALSFGRKISRNPRDFASATIGSTPFTRLRFPSRESSPRNSIFLGSNLISSLASKYAKEIATSKIGPSFFISAGARETTTF